MDGPLRRPTLLLEQMVDETKEFLSGDGVPEDAPCAGRAQGEPMTWWKLRDHSLWRSLEETYVQLWTFFG